MVPMIDLDAMNRDPWPTWPVDKKELHGLVNENKRRKAIFLQLAEPIGRSKPLFGSPNVRSVYIPDWLIEEIMGAINDD
jgi:hypothetical protein